MKKISKLLAVFLGLSLLGFGAPDMAKAAYPDRPVTIIIPFGPGGAVDIAARILAEYFQNKHQITLNIVCKGGGAGAPAMLDVARARPDGYTFGFPALATFSATPQIRKTGYTIDDFKAVAQVTNMWLSLSVNKDSGISNLNEFFEMAKKEPGKYNYATHGALSTQRIFMTNILKAYPDVNLPHISYTSGHDVSTALLGKHVSAAFGVTINQKPYVDSGDFTMIAVSSDKRLEEFPNVPTFKEQLGDNDTFVFASSHGLLAPKRTPDSCIIAMQDLIKEALEDSSVQEKFKKAGLTADYLPAAEFQTVMEDIWDYIGKTLKENNF